MSEERDIRVAEALGRIEGKLDNMAGWVRAINRDVKTNTRWRWGMAGIMAFLTALGTVFGLFK